MAGSVETEQEVPFGGVHPSHARAAVAIALVDFGLGRGLRERCETGFFESTSTTGLNGFASTATTTLAMS